MWKKKKISKRNSQRANFNCSTHRRNELQYICKLKQDEEGSRRGRVARGFNRVSARCKSRGSGAAQNQRKKKNSRAVGKRWKRARCPADYFKRLTFLSFFFFTVFKDLTWRSSQSLKAHRASNNGLVNNRSIALESSNHRIIESLNRRIIESFNHRINFSSYSLLHFQTRRLFWITR